MVYSFFIFLLITTSQLEVSASDTSVKMTVFHLTDSDKNLGINEAALSRNFSKAKDISSLNFGLSSINHWIKIVLSNSKQDDLYKLSINSIGPDTIEVYQKVNYQYQKALIGEPIYDQYRFPTYHFKTSKYETTLFLKVKGVGHPVAMPLSIEKISINSAPKYISILFTGFVYGVIFLVIILSSVLFFGTRDKLYVYFLLLNIFSFAVIFYFDGFVRLYLFPNSAYWNNQFIAIAFIGSFIAANYYIPSFLNLKNAKPQIIKYFHLLNVMLLIVLLISFWHPAGFKFYVIANIVLTSCEGILYFISVLSIRKIEKEYFPIQFVSVLLIIFFGTLAQLYFMGYTPVNIFTVYAVHGMIIPQIMIQSMALGKRYTILTKERADLLKASKQHSQSLITTLEHERKRLSSEFHDSIGQNLLVIRNRILLMLKGKHHTEHSDKLKGLANITSETLDEIRAISQDLRPSTLDTIGLTASLANMILRIKKSTEINITLECKEEIDGVVPQEMEINVYRILQELMSNVLKHSRATNASISIKKNASCLILLVADDGIGLDTETTFASNLGNGISGIKERVKLLKGTIHFSINENEGLNVKVKIPKQ